MRMLTRCDRRREPAVEAEPRRPRAAAILLAAGQSRRMGATNKLLADVGGTPMVARVADALLASSARPVVAVTERRKEPTQSTCVTVTMGRQRSPSSGTTSLTKSAMAPAKGADRKAIVSRLRR